MAGCIIELSFTDTWWRILCQGNRKGKAGQCFLMVYVAQSQTGCSNREICLVVSLGPLKSLGTPASRTLLGGPQKGPHSSAGPFVKLATVIHGRCRRQELCPRPALSTTVTISRAQPRRPPWPDCRATSLYCRSWDKVQYRGFSAALGADCWGRMDQLHCKLDCLKRDDRFSSKSRTNLSIASTYVEILDERNGGGSRRSQGDCSRSNQKPFKRGDCRPLTWLM